MENNKTLKHQLEEKKNAIKAAQEEIKVIEHKMKLEGVKTSFNAMTDAISGDETVLEKLCDFSPKEAAIIGKRIAENFSDMIAKSMDEIKTYRKEKAENDAKRKNRQAKMKAEKSGEQTVTKSADEPAKHAEQKPVQTMTEPVKQSEQKPVQQVAQTAAPQVQQNAQQPVQRPVQSLAQTAPQTQQKPVPGNAMYGSQGASQTQSGNGIRYTPDGGR